MTKPILFILGLFTVIVGMTFLLGNWDAATLVFKGVMPSAIAVAGLVIMFAATLKK